MPLSKKLLACLAAALTVGAVSVPAASAATEVGNNCTANTGAPNFTLLQLSQAPGSSPLPLVAPAAGVVTKWTVNSAVSAPGLTIAERMRVFRAAGAANEFRTIAESSPGVVQSGSNTFATQIPVQAGDRFGAYAPTGSAVVFCSTASPADLLGAKEGDVGPGGTATYMPVEKVQLALSVTIEPDVDGDGFGDETQDKCPQSAAQQAACPALKLKAVSVPPGKSAIRILVATDSQAAITVSASAKVPKGKKGKGTTTANLAPVVQLVSPGEIIVYTINFSKALKDALKVLPRKKSISLDIVAEGKSVAGASTSERLTVKVKGQAKPPPGAKR
jgi:hypothetical protein